MRIRYNVPTQKSTEGQPAVATTPSMALTESCTMGLTHIGMLAELLKTNGLGQYSLNFNGKPTADVREIDRLLTANGIWGLLRVLPFSKHSLKGFADLSVISGLLATVSKTFKVDFAEPHAAASLKQELQRICQGQNFNLSASPPQLHLGSSLGLMHLGSAALVLKKHLNIELFGANGKEKLEAMLSDPLIIQILSQLGQHPLPIARMQGLTDLAKVSLGANSMSSRFSSEQRHDIAPVNSSPFVHLKTGPLGSLWPTINEGSIGPHFKLPDTSQVAMLSEQKAALKTIGLATGLKLSDPDFTKKYTTLLRSFQTSGICSVIHGSRITANQLEGLKRLSSFNSGLKAVHNGLDVHILEQGAGAKLAHAIGTLNNQVLSSANGSGDWTEVIRGLKRLADLAIAVS